MGAAAMGATALWATARVAPTISDDIVGAGLAPAPISDFLIVSEFLKARFNAGFASNLFFWRDNVGLEVDLLLDEPEGLLPVEIKSSATVTDDLFKGLRKWLAVAGDAARLPRLVCAVPESYQRDGINVRRWQEAADQ